MSTVKNERRINMFVILGEMALVLALVIILIVCVVKHNSNKQDFLYPVVEIEAGTDCEITADMFLLDEEKEAVFLEGSEPFDTDTPGDYRLIIGSEDRAAVSILRVVDTTAPDCKVRILNIGMGDTCDADAFVYDINEIDDYSVEFISDVDFSLPGYQNIDILIEDRSHNTLTVHTRLFITAVKDRYVMEAGSKLPDVSELVLAAQSCSYSDASMSADLSKAGTYTVGVIADGEEYPVIIEAVDTTAPVFNVVDVNGYVGVEYAASDFANDVKDASEVTFVYEESPDFSLVGTQFVTVIATDEYGNTSVEPAFLKLSLDNEPPVITGVHDREAYVGEGISYKDGITVTDNSGTECFLEVTSTRTNLNEEGEFEIVYTATDPAGNSTSIKAALLVGQCSATQEQAERLVDYFLGQILTPEMDDIEKLWAIYDFLYTRIAYVDGTPKGDPIGAVYTALNSGYGDCFAYACTCEMFLTRAGFKNMRINKIPADTRHYWNLVDIGDGWYHLDCCLRVDRPRIFLWNDDLLMEYSNTHDKSHNYDRNKVPEVNSNGDIYKFYYGEDYVGPEPVLGTVLTKLRAEQAQH